MYRSSNQRGLTLIELIVVITVLIILLTTVFILVNPVYFRAKSRDQKRLSDLQILERVVTEFRLDHGSYPDLESVTRTSMELPSGGVRLADPRAGWIGANLIEYTPRLPVDPINNETYYYSYRHDNDTFELNAPLEVVTDLMANDAGNDPNVYEIGSSLSLISP